MCDRGYGEGWGWVVEGEGCWSYVRVIVIGGSGVV